MTKLESQHDDVGRDMVSCFFFLLPAELAFKSELSRSQAALGSHGKFFRSGVDLAPTRVSRPSQTKSIPDSSETPESWPSQP